MKYLETEPPQTNLRVALWPKSLGCVRERSVLEFSVLCPDRYGTWGISTARRRAEQEKRN